MSEERTGYEVAVRDEQRDAVLFPTWAQMREQASVLVKSQFFPKSIKTPEQALAVMMMGRELGIGTMESVRSIYPIEGKPTASAAHMGALILRSGASYTIDQSTDQVCEITFKRRDGKCYSHTFTIEDAKRAKLTSKAVWQSYPKAMLYNRCMAAGARAFMPNIIMNLYTPEELDVPVRIEGDDMVIDGEVVEQPTPMQIRKAQAGEWQAKHGQVDQSEPHPEPTERNGNGEYANDWVGDRDRRAAFWAKTADMALDHNDVHEACGVETMKDFAGTFDEAIAACNAWLGAKLEEEAVDRAEQEGPPY